MSASRCTPSCTRAALIYQHATSQRDREIAAGMDRRIAEETRRRPGRRGKRKKPDDGDDGAAGVLVPAG